MSSNLRADADASTEAPGADLRAHLSILIAALLWGTSGLVGRLAGDVDVPPIAVAAARMVVAGLALLPFARRGPALPSRRGIRPSLVAVGLLLAGYQVAYFSSIPHVGVTVATLVALGLPPALVAIAAPLVGDARADRRTWTAVALAVGGLVLLVGGAGAALPDGGSPVLGVVLAVLCAVGYSGVSLFGRALGDVDPLRLVSIAFAVGGALMLPVLLTADVPVTPRSIGLLAYVGLLPTALAYLLFFRGAGRVAAPVTTLITLLEPVTAALLALAFLGERLAPTGMVGALLVVGAVLLVTRRRRTRLPPAGG